MSTATSDPSSAHHAAQSTRSTDTETAKSAASDLRRDAEEKARKVGQTVADEAHARAEGAKQGVADEISSVSAALRRASDELRDGSPQERTFGAVANSMADFADTVRGKDLGEMVGDLSDFARRNPVAFLGGAALLGFAGVRMAKASQRARLTDERDVYAPRSGAPDPHTGATPYAGAATPGTPGVGAGTSGTATTGPASTPPTSAQPTGTIGGKGVKS